MCLIPTGSIVATPAALSQCEQHGVDAMSLINRHKGGDWGDICMDDVKANIHAIQHDLRVLSVYKVGGERLYCITEADRSSTCFLLCDEY